MYIYTYTYIYIYIYIHTHIDTSITYLHGSSQVVPPVYDIPRQHFFSGLCLKLSMHILSNTCQRMVSHRAASCNYYVVTSLCAMLCNGTLHRTPLYTAASHRIASHRVAPSRAASRRVAPHRGASHRTAPRRASPHWVPLLFSDLSCVRKGSPRDVRSPGAPGASPRIVTGQWAASTNRSGGSERGGGGARVPVPWPGRWASS